MAAVSKPTLLSHSRLHAVIQIFALSKKFYRQEIIGLKSFSLTLCLEYSAAAGTRLGTVFGQLAPTQCR
jgi:hypothetical protein